MPQILSRRGLTSPAIRWAKLFAYNSPTCIMHGSLSVGPPMSIEPHAFNLGVRTPLCVMGRHSEAAI